MIRESYSSFDSLIQAALGVMGQNTEHHYGEKEKKDPQAMNYKVDRDHQIIMMSEDADLEEITAKRRFVVRGGKKVRKKICGPGFRLVGGKCKKQTAREKLARKLAAKKAARRRKGKNPAIARRRKRSMTKRRSFGL
jgi:hypothetical protein